MHETNNTWDSIVTKDFKEVKFVTLLLFRIFAGQPFFMFLLLNHTPLSILAILGECSFQT